VVEVDASAFEGKSEKINITLPKLLLKRIDDYTHAKHLTRSGFLAEAARAAMR
jgi:metal-responsive CopG/Arc/MetJ family transcriptional regulator